MKTKLIIEWLNENWFLLVVLGACVAFVIRFIIRFFRMSAEEQKGKVKEWLIWACIESERELQSGTGQIKLRKVYDRFCAVPAFKLVALMIPFSEFSEWVSIALKTAKDMLINNRNLALYVYGENATEQVKYLIKQLTGE